MKKIKKSTRTYRHHCTFAYSMRKQRHLRNDLHMAREDKTDSVRVTFKDGCTYFTHTSNVVLYND